MQMRRRPWGLTVVFATITLAVGLFAIPGATTSGTPGPVAAVDFVDAWTNDDGNVDAGDAGDTGLVSPGYDAWNLFPISSSDPADPGIDPPREDKDVAICTAEVRVGDPDYVDVIVNNAYPGYVCTFTIVLENGTVFPVEVTPAVVDADPGLLVQTEDPQFPGTLGPGLQASAVFSVSVLNDAPQGVTLHFTITTHATTPPCDASVAFGVERGSGDLYQIDPVAGTSTLLAAITDPATGNVNSPNGLAHDADNGRLYFSANNVASDAVASSDLYFWDGVGTVHAGVVPGLPAGAEYADGAYYYFLNNTDDLYRVTFNPDGTVAASTLFAADVSGNSELLRFGDLVINGTTLYGSTNGPATNFFSITGLGSSNTYTEISSPQGSRLQLAFGDDGVLYGQSTGTGEFFTVNPATGATASLGVPSGSSDWMTDLASGFCTDEWPPRFAGGGPEGCVLPEDPVAHWPGDGDANDFVGTNDGSLVGGTGFVGARCADGFWFDGIDDHVAVADHPSLEPGTGDFSMSLWIKFDSVPTDRNARPVYKDDGQAAGWGLLLNGGNQRMIFYAGDGNVHPSSLAWATNSVVAGAWYHVAGVRDTAAGTVSIYINGQLNDVVADATGDASVNRDLLLGGRPTEFFNGTLDEVAIWNRVLTPAEIQQLAGFSVGPILYGVEEGTGDLFRIDVGAGVAEQVVDLPPLTSTRDALAYDPASDRLYFAYSEGGGATESDLYYWDGSDVVLAGTVPGEATHATFMDGQYLYLPSPNADRGSSRIAFDTYWAPDGEIALVGPGGGTVDILFDDPDHKSETSPAWSPDGTQFVFMVQGSPSGIRYLSSKTVAGAGRTQWTTYGSEHSPDWSPDGTTIAFHSARVHSAYNDIYVMPVGGGVETKIAAGSDPSWSPDGSRIAVTRNEPHSLCTMDPDGSDQVCVTGLDRPDEPDWSPDGTKIVFQQDVPGGRAIFVIDADGTGLIQLTSLSGVAGFPSWSPDGTRIVFERYAVLWVMDADGTNLNALVMTYVDSAGTHYPGGKNPAWEPKYQPLMGVGFDPGGAVDTMGAVFDTIHLYDTFRSGDIAVNPAGTTLYGSTAQSGDTPPTFYSVDLATGTYTEISTSDGTGLQLAFGSNGVLYGHDMATGGFFTIDPSTGATVSIGVPAGIGNGFTDLAAEG